jgi:Rhamnan synthesis protein F
MSRKTSLLKAFAARLSHLGGEMESRLIVYPIELFARIWYHLDLRVYFEGLRIRTISKGCAKKKSNRYVLFVLYVRGKTPPFIETLFRAIGRTRLNLVISTNARITPAQRQALLENCHLLIERADLGRDFGGYRDGIRYLLRTGEPIERLILLNDSLFYLEGGLDTLLAELDGEHDVIGLTEDFHLYYHVQSFALSFSGHVLKNNRFLSYWRKYRPISTRRWAIQKGERGLTRQLIRSGFAPHIIHYGAQLTPHLRSLKLGDLLDAVRLLPPTHRQRLYDEFDDIHETQTTALLSSINALVKGARRLHLITDAQLSDMRDSSIAQMLSVSDDTAAIQEEAEHWVLDAFLEKIILIVSTRNQIHVGGFLFSKFLGMPVIKRDIFYREIYPLHEIDEILSQFNEPMKDHILADLRQKGTAKLLTGLRQVLYRHGAI